MDRLFNLLAILAATLQLLSSCDDTDSTCAATIAAELDAESQIEQQWDPK